MVGIEGTTVKGICELEYNGWNSYRHQSPEVYNYAQTIGFPVDWVDWEPALFGFTPKPPNRSVQGIKRLNNEHQSVMNAWQNNNYSLLNF